MKIYLSSGGVGLEVSCENDLANALTEFAFLKQYVPDLDVSLEETKSILATLEVTEGPYSFDYENNNYKISAKVGSNLSLHDLVTLIDHVFERERQLKGVYCLHGSASSFNGKGVWFMGPVSGLGKTTLNLSLCMDHGFKFIGDEKVLLDERINLSGGVKDITYNKEGLMSSLSVNFHNMTAQELGSKIQIEGSRIPLKLMILPVLVKGCSLMEEDMWDERKIAFHLFEELSRKIRGVSRRVNNFRLPVDSIDSLEISTSRSDIANLTASKISAYILKGSKELIEKRVVDIVKNLE